MIKIFFVMIYTTFLIGDFIPTVQSQYGQYSEIIISNYFDDYDELEIDSVYENLDVFLKNDTLKINQLNTYSGIETVQLLNGENQYSIVVNKRYSKFKNFEYYSNEKDLNVYVMGNFNDWNRKSHKMNYSSGKYSFNMNFTPGIYQYKFVVDGAEILDLNNLDSIPNGLGGWNNYFEVEDENNNITGQLVKSKITQISDSTILDFKFEKNYQEEKLNSKKTFVFLNNNILNDDYVNIRKSKISITLLKSFNGRLRIICENNFGQVLRENHTIIKDGFPLNPTSNPDNIHFTVMYSLMIDRFHNGNRKNDKPFEDDLLNHMANYHGGDFSGITRKLKEGYFSNLGINMIWISPVLKGPSKVHYESVPPYRKYSGYHGYWPVSNNELEPRFGSSEDFKKLVANAHERNIKVIVDFVSNHVHEEHPYHIQYPEWFSSYNLQNGEKNLRRWDGDTRLTTWFESFLPTFDFNKNPEAIDAVVNDAISFIDEYNVDGFRQDATKHVPHKFWKTFTKSINKAYPNKNIFQIGETFGSDALILSYVNPSELNSQFNFDIYFNARKLFVDPESSFLDFNKIIDRNMYNYQPINQMGTITSSHDQVRFMAFADKQIEFHENGIERAYEELPSVVQYLSSYEKLFGFTVMNMSLPGIPVVYYGEEYGQIGANDPGNRLDMRFQSSWNKAEHRLNKKIKQLISLRRTNPAFALGDLTFIKSSKNISIWKKTYFEDEVLVLFNIADESEFVELKLNSVDSLISLLSQDVISVNNSKIKFVLGPNETRIYKIEK